MNEWYKVLSDKVQTSYSLPPLLKSICFPLVIPTIGMRAKSSGGESLQLGENILRWKSTSWVRSLKTRKLKYISYYMN